MSLTLEQFDKAMERWKRLNERVNLLLEKMDLKYRNVVDSDHYGNNRLFGNIINDSMQDDELIGLINIKNIVQHQKNVIKEIENERSSLIKSLMLKAIRSERPAEISTNCLDVWNQPFFYKIDKAKALTISYNPTDRGARINYANQLAAHKITPLKCEEIYDILYNFIVEPQWRRNYNAIFTELDISEDNISHMDVSIFPYKKLDMYMSLRHYDYTYKYLLQTIDLLADQLKYILIDGSKNKDIFSKFLSQDFVHISSAKLPVNSGKNLYELSIYKHKQKDLFLIYYGCFLYGATTPKRDQILEIAKFIKSKTSG